MDKNIKDAILNIQENFALTEDEKIFIDYSNTGHTGNRNHSRVLSTLLLTKQLKQSTEQIIKSNEGLAKSEDNHAKKMQYLTWALVGVGTIQVVVMLINVLT